MSERREIYERGLCAGCVLRGVAEKREWEAWCRGCNLVYCRDHRTDHSCAPKEDRAKLYPEPRRRKKKAEATQ